MCLCDRILAVILVHLFHFVFHEQILSLLETWSTMCMFQQPRHYQGTLRCHKQSQKSIELCSLTLRLCYCYTEHSEIVSNDLRRNWHRIHPVVFKFMTRCGGLVGGYQRLGGTLLLGAKTGQFRSSGNGPDFRHVKFEFQFEHPVS
jgi:hypothetical protein